MAGDETASVYTSVSAGADILHFHIIEQIGAGGMGEVYLADDTKLHRRVALKFLPAGLAVDHEHVARFVREAQAAARLNHPNIIVVFEVGEYRGRPFFAMELLDGMSLHALASQGSLSMEDIAGIARQVTEGLAHAHSLGVVHRDIKGGNIFVTKDNRVKILDFGLAALADSRRITAVGSTMGTISYMAPEQIKGHPADQRSDLFSLGVVLYELITGQLPFRRDNDAATMQAILTEPPEPLSRKRPGISDDWQRIIDKALQKEPSWRYQTALDMLADLKRLGQMSHPSLKVTDHRKVLAVLPFENIGAADQDYFSDGITDEITSRLAKLRDVTVISNSSAQQYKKTEKRLKQVAQELGAGFLLQGTIRWDKSGTVPRVRINAKLIRAEDESYLWAETYDRVLEQIFAVQSELAEKVADALGVTLVGKDQKSHPTGGTSNLEAYDAFLKAADKFPGSLDIKDMLEAMALYRHATELDPNYAAAYARLGSVEVALFHFAGGNIMHLEQARQHIEKAFQLSPGLLEAHLALGDYYHHGTCEYSRAAEQFQTAYTLEPNSVRAALGLSLVHRRQGLYEQSIEEGKRLILLDPRNMVIPHQLCISYWFVRRYDEALKYIDRAIWLKPGFGDSYQMKAWVVAMQKCDLQAGIDVYREVHGQIPLAAMNTDWFDFDFVLGVCDNDPAQVLAELTPDEMDVWLYLLTRARLFRLLGQKEPMEATLEALRALLERTSRDRPDDPQVAVNLGLTYALMGRVEQAITWGEKAVALRPVSQDALEGTILLGHLANIHILIGQYDRAIDLLEQLVRIPGFVNQSFLSIASACDPIRHLPRFQKLLQA